MSMSSRPEWSRGASESKINVNAPPILLRVRLQSPSVTYHPVFDACGTGESVLHAAVARLEGWYGRSCWPVLSAREGWRCSVVTRIDTICWTESGSDLEACLEVMHSRGLLEAVLCYPEFAWSFDTAFPPSLPQDAGAAVRQNGWQSVVWVRRSTLETMLNTARSVGINIASLSAAAGFLEQMGGRDIAGLRSTTLSSITPWGSNSSFVLQDGKTARAFLAAADRRREERVIERHIPLSTHGDPHSLRVLFVCGTSAHSGAEESMLHFAAGLQQRGVDTTLSIPLEGVVAERFRAHGGTVLCDNVARSEPTPAHVQYFRHQIRNARSSVLHCIGPCGLAPLIAAHLEGVPSIYHVHWLSLNQLAPEMEWCSRVVAVSKVARQCVISNHIEPERVYVVRNGVDTRGLVSNGDLDVSKRTIDVLCIGRYSAEKGHDLLLRAVKELVNVIPLQSVLTVGDDIGPNTTLPAIRQSIERLGLSGIVRCQGFSADASEYLRTSKCLVVTSRTEAAAPLVALEAMAAGVPVVAPSLPGIEEMVSGSGAAVLFRPGDAHDCATGLKRVLTDPIVWRSMARAGRQLVARQFRWDESVSNLLAIMHDMLAESAARRVDRPHR